MTASDMTPQNINKPEGNTHVSYDRTVAAALAETKSKFALAEALALDIPPRPSGGDFTPAWDETVMSYLEDAQDEIRNAGGEPRSVGTLRDYRLTALWVSADLAHDFAWVPGVSYSSHSEARKHGLSYEEFAKLPKKTVDVLRKRSGLATTDGQPEKIAQSWTPEQKAEVAGKLIREAAAEKRADVVREILADPEVAQQVSEEITDYVASDSKRTAEVLRKRDDAPRPVHRPRVDDVDYDEMIGRAVDWISIALGAEGSGKWQPTERTEALLYFLTQVLGDRKAPTGENAELVNDKLEDLFAEVEKYANTEAS